MRANTTQWLEIKSLLVTDSLAQWKESADCPSCTDIHPYTLLYIHTNIHKSKQNTQPPVELTSGGWDGSSSRCLPHMHEGLNLTHRSHGNSQACSQRQLSEYSHGQPSLMRVSWTSKSHASCFLTSTHVPRYVSIPNTHTKTEQMYLQIKQNNRAWQGMLVTLELGEAETGRPVVADHWFTLSGALQLKKKRWAG